MAIDIGRFMDRFVDEAREHLGRLGEGLAALESGHADAELINALFRSAHTVKGSSRMLKLTPVTDTAHLLEDVLGALREGRVRFDRRLAGALYQGVDAIAAQVDCLAATRDPAALPAPAAALCAALAAAAAPDSAPDRGNPLPPPAGDAADTPGPAGEGGNAEAARGRQAGFDTVRIRVDKLDELIGLMGEFASSQARVREWAAQAHALERELARGIADPARLPAVHERMRAFERTLRDGVRTQDMMIGALHERTLVMRMLPLGVIFDAMGRMMRDFARSLGKDVEFVVRGSEIELDRQLIDKLSDPLVHLLRNAVDHGLEAPAVRRRRGKAERGRVELVARQEGAQAVIEVADDGAGIDFDAVREKALARGLIDAGEAAALSEKAVIDLLFLPGFSTAGIVTDVSGRGVGLDVVRQTLAEELSGEIGVHSRPGQGTRFVLRLPLSLVRLRILLVEVGGHPFGIPAHGVSEIVRRPAEALLKVAERSAVIVRNEFVPVVALDALLGLPPRPAPGGGALLLVLSVRGDKIALRVDALLDERDMVIKPLPPMLAQARFVTGVVETGSGALASVLHAPALFVHARHAGADAPRRAPGSAAGNARRLLVVDDSLNTRELEKEVLEAHGYLVTLAEDGVDGLAKALAEDFDAVLTDVEMPRMDGFSLTARLREDERYRHRPILIITSRERDEDKRRGMQVGADAYIVKGDFDQRSLVETLKTLLA